MPNEKARAVAWAKAYPFDVGAGSFVYAQGQAFPLGGFSGGCWHEAAITYEGRAVALDEFAAKTQIDLNEINAPRVAVVACGSNAAPQRMAQKFGASLPGALVPTIKVELRDYCVVHSAKIAAYGSIPATLARAPGAKVSAFVNLLTSDQLAVMDKTEDLGVEYHRPTLGDGAVVFEDGTYVEAAQAYVSLHGALHKGGAPFALASVGGKHIPFDALHQHEVQGLAQDLLAVSGALDDFIHNNITDSALRKSRSHALRDNHGIPFSEGD